MILAAHAPMKGGVRRKGAYGATRQRHPCGMNSVALEAAAAVFSSCRPPPAGEAAVIRITGLLRTGAILR